MFWYDKGLEMLQYFPVYLLETIDNNANFLNQRKFSIGMIPHLYTLYIV